MASQADVAWSGLLWQRVSSVCRWPWELIPLVAVFAWLYRQTMPPGISSWIVEGWDSAMFQVTGSTWGIPHSPGYPLYTILANLFVRLTGLLPAMAQTEVVWRVSYWSTITSLLCLIFVYLIVRRIGRNRAAAIVASAVLGLSFIFWRAAIMAEIYSLNALLFALAYWFAIVWSADRRDRWLMLLGFVLGAAIAHHRTALALVPTIGLWVMVVPEKKRAVRVVWPQRWKTVGRRWAILLGFSLIPILSYLYLPLAAQLRAGQTWIYADTSDWNTFWFVVVSREWWGLVEIPDSLVTWLDALAGLFRQQAEQITVVGVLAGIIGLLAARRYVWLLGPPFLMLVFFGISYKVPDLDSMLIPLTLTLCLGLGILASLFIRQAVSWGLKSIRVRNQDIRGDRWLSTTMTAVLSVLFVIGAYFFYRPLARANYEAVDLSGDWQAVDLVEEVAAIAGAGTPLTIIGQDNSVLPDFIYARAVLGHPVEPLSTTTLGRMPEEASIALLRDRFEQGRRVLIDIESIDLGFIPWLTNAVETGQIFASPTGHPYLWELLPRPFNSYLPDTEAWIATPPGQFLDGQISIIAFHEQIISKRTGCFLRLTLFWRVETPTDQDYFVSVQPLGGETVLDNDNHLALMRGFLPTSQVRPGEIIRDEVDLLIRQPAALPGIMLVINLFQVQGDQFPTFGQVTLPITVDPEGCNR